jgi:cytochrome c551/c552
VTLLAAGGNAGWDPRPNMAGRGNRGQMPMPPQSLSREDVEALVRWILSHQ